MEGVFFPGCDPAGYWGELDRLIPQSSGRLLKKVF